MYDPWADANKVKKEYRLDLIENNNLANYEAITLAVAHDEFIKLDLKVNNQQVFFDIKSIVDSPFVDGRL